MIIIRSDGIIALGLRVSASIGPSLGIMTKIAESLRVLELSSSATLKDANQAYKELVRVWHPDRFQSDEKLKRRAEENTRKCNNAIEHLRSVFKDMPPGSSLEDLECSEEEAQTSSSSYDDEDFSDDWDDRDYEEDEPRSSFSKSFDVDSATFQKRFFQTGTFAILRFIKGLLAIGFSYLLYLYIEITPPVHLIIAVIFASRGATSILRNIGLFILRRPILVISSTSLHIIEFGSVSVRYITEVQVTGDTGRYKIRINLCPEFLDSVPFECRFILQIRHFFKGSHFVLKGRGLDEEPTLAPHLFRLARSLPALQAEAGNLLPLRGLAWSQIIASGCVLTCATRCFLSGDIVPEVTAPYIVIFVMCRVYSLIVGIMPQPRIQSYDEKRV